MTKSIPHHLLNPQNEKVFDFLADKSCHSDIIEPIDRFLSAYEAVHFFCPDPIYFAYCFWYREDEIIACAVGMQRVYLKIKSSEFIDLDEAVFRKETSIGEVWGSIAWNHPQLVHFVSRAIRKALYEIHDTFLITGRGIVFAGHILEGEINTGDWIDLEVYGKTLRRKIIGIDGIRQSSQGKPHLGILIECQDEAEMNVLRAWEPEEMISEIH